MQRPDLVLPHGRTPCALTGLPPDIPRPSYPVATQYLSDYLRTDPLPEIRHPGYVRHLGLEHSIPTSLAVWPAKPTFIYATTHVQYIPL